MSDQDKDLSPLFSGSDAADQATAEAFRDRVRAILEHFDLDKDDHLNMSELAALQRATAGTVLTEEMYVMACRALDCHPSTGISLGALKLTYASPGSDLEKDYQIIFSSATQQPPAKSEEEPVYEVGADGTIDIS
eukprot:Nitzschia sp. Nitz4//scaffold17_size182527//92702//93106//NITZ4_001856-RA/size182527-processed-gene-0.18-mRNA-1//1//CDS//3329539346//970//frame0